MSIRTCVWIALLLPPLAWFGFEQGLSAVLHASCSQSGIGVAWGIAALALCALSLRLAWRLRGPRGTLADPWLASLATGLSAFFALAIAFQTLAILMVPACVR